MDTRNKILELEAVLRQAGTRPIVWVRGSFDPLVAEYARRIEEAAAPNSLLAVAVMDWPGSLLSLRARAELVAALGCVDFVVADGQLPDSIKTIDLDLLAVREALLDRVRTKHAGSLG